MKKISVMGALFVLGLLLQGCEKEEISEMDVQVNSAYATASVAATNDYSWNVYFKKNLIPVGEYDILFRGSTKEFVGDEVIATTFSYSVSGTGTTAQLDSFYIGIPGCAGVPSSWSPTQSAKLEDNFLKWNSSVSKDGAQEYSVTYPGNVDYGLVKAIIVRGGIEYVAEVVGPCAGAYNLTGYVFVDANGDGIKQATESGLPNYTVVLDQGDNTSEVISAADGSYSFRVLPEVYNLSVKDNPLNAEYYTPTFTGAKSITVPGDLTDPEYNPNFGYNAVTSKLTEDFSSGAIILTTASAKEWGQAIKMAGKNNSSFTVQEVNDLLAEVEGLLLDVPFRFQGNKISAALDILTKPIKTDEDLFLQQLLAAELNYVYDRGAVDSGGQLKDDFNLALIKYAEAIAAGVPGGAATQSLSIMAITSRSYSLSGTSTLLASFNDNGSGGL